MEIAQCADSKSLSDRKYADTVLTSGSSSGVIPAGTNVITTPYHRFAGAASISVRTMEIVKILGGEAGWAGNWGIGRGG